MATGVKVRKGSAQNARARRAFRLRKKISGTPSRPVSYTHLTLPTICSV